MARATKVYVVLLNQRPVAGFTVKHECHDWLAEQHPCCPTNLRVMSIPDGAWKLKRFDIKDITADFYGLGEKDR